MANKISLTQIPSAIDELLADFLHQSFEVRQKAVQAGSEVFKSAVEAATPKDTGTMAQSWQIKTKYNDRRYVGNTKTVNGKGADGRVRDGIPLSNILEYKESSKHYGFIRQTYAEQETQIYDAIKNQIRNGGQK